MKRITQYAATALIVSASVLASASAYAQTADMVAVPVLYNSAGTAVNNSGTGYTLPAGYYKLANGDQVYYYGNGTYYDQTAQVYGGTVSDPSGASGVYDVTGVTSTVGAPNTGAGGAPGTTLLVLALSGIVAVAGVTYLTRKAATRILA